MRIDLSRLTSAERVLWDAGVTEPDHIDLPAIAAAHDAMVVYRQLDGCSARLVASSTGAVISVNSGDYPGRKRFSLAHELAHWLCDRKTGSFLCAKSDIGPQNAEAKSVEAHANAFASQLILPDYLVTPWAHGKKANLDVAASLANDFKVSRTAAAIKLTKRSSVPTCVVCHDQSRLKWHSRNLAFGRFLCEARASPGHRCVHDGLWRRRRQIATQKGARGSLDLGLGGLSHDGADSVLEAS